MYVSNRMIGMPYFHIDTDCCPEDSRNEIVCYRSIYTPIDFALGLLAFGLLVIWKVPPWIVVVLSALVGMGLSLR